MKAWREYNIHPDNKSNDGASDDDDDTPVDIFGQAEEEDEIIEFPIHVNDNNDDDNDNDGDDDDSKSNKPRKKVILQLEGQSDYRQSTGVVVWRGAEVLAEYLQTYPRLVQGQHVLELGSGLGLCGLTAHHLGAKHVTLTDGDMVVLSRLQRNLQANAKPNSSSIECRQLIWGQHQSFQGLQKDSDDNERSSSHCYNVVMATDCMYMRQSLRPFWETVAALLCRKGDATTSGVFLYVNVCASSASLEDVLEVATEFGFTWSVVDFHPRRVGGGNQQNHDIDTPVYTFKLKTSG